MRERATWKGLDVWVLDELDGGDLLIQYRDAHGELRAKIVPRHEVRRQP